MNILGIDYGSKNIGLSWCDTEIGVVLPFGIVNNIKRSEGLKELKKIIVDEKINKVIFGLPLGFNGSENENTKRIRIFASSLQEIIDVPIEFDNELFSSQQADRMTGGASRDEKSAMIILESYLSKIK